MQSDKTLPKPPNWELVKKDIEGMTDSDPLFLLRNVAECGVVLFAEDELKEDIEVKNNTDISKNIINLQTSTNVLINACQVLENEAKSLNLSSHKIAVAVNEVERQLKQTVHNCFC